MTWLFPGMLAATTAAIVPLLIHLLMRPRPRRQVFPALQLLREAHRDGARARQVQHWLVLLARMAAIALIAMALARPVLRASSLPFAPRGAVTAVFCLDDSASMGYVRQGRSDLQRAVEWATALVGDEQRFGGGSRFGVVRASEPDQTVLTPNRDAAIRRLNAATPGPHDRGLREMLESAVRLATRQAGGMRSNSAGAGGEAGAVGTTGPTESVGASGASQAEPFELYVLTDLTRHGCRAAVAANELPAGARVYLLDVGSADRANISIIPAGDFVAGGDGATPSAMASDRPAQLSAVVRAAGERFTGRVEAWLDGQFAARSGPVGVAPGAAVQADILLPPPGDGMHALELRLDPRDALGADDTALLAIDARPRPRVAIAAGGRDAQSASPARAPRDAQGASRVPPAPDAHGASGVADDRDAQSASRAARAPTAHGAVALEARRFAALLSPASLPDDRQPFEVRTIDLSDLEAEARVEAKAEVGAKAPADALAAFDWIILLEPRGIDAALAAALQRWTRGGGLLLVVPGPGAASASQVEPRTGAAADSHAAAAWPDASLLGATPESVQEVADGLAIGAEGAAPADHPAAEVENSTRDPQTSSADGASRSAEAAPAPSAAGDDAAASLAGRRARRYVQLRPADERSVRLRFENGAAAVIDQPIGDGRAVWWAFSLRAEWSDLGVRAAPILLRLHAMGRQARGARPRVAQALCGRPATVFVAVAEAVTDGTRSASGAQPREVREVRMVRGSEGDGAVVRVARPAADGRLRVATEFAGFYRVLADDGRSVQNRSVALTASAQPSAAAPSTPKPGAPAANANHRTDGALALYAVNLPPEEGDPARLTDAEALALFPPSAAEVHHEPATLLSSASAAAADHPLDTYLLLLAVALLFGENALSRRAYRRAAGAAADVGVPASARPPGAIG